MWPSSPALAWASRGSKVSSMPKSFSLAESLPGGGPSFTAPPPGRRALGPCRWAGADGGLGLLLTVVLGAGDQDALDRLVGRVPDDESPRQAASRREAPYLSARRTTPWAWRSR
jgi:hypothetical protein